MTENNVIKIIKKAAEENCKLIDKYLKWKDLSSPNDIKQEVYAILEEDNKKSFYKHRIIEAFQKKICERLSTLLSSYTWKREHINSDRPEGDKVDIIGLPKDKNNPIIIIEIDASRGDQVSKKLLSRIRLWGLDNNILYIALLYPDTQKGKVESEKFVEYGNAVLKKINENSSAYGMYIDNNNIELWDFNNKRFKIGSDCFYTMIDCAKQAIKKIMGLNCNYDSAKVIFNKEKYTFVKRVEGKSRHSRLDDTDIYVYTQWHEYGTDWKEFKKICADKNYTISKVEND